MTSNKKRKREQHDTGNSSRTPTATVKVGAQLQYPPLLASVHGIKLSKSTRLTPYSRQKIKGKDVVKEEYLLHGESERMEYEAVDGGELKGLSQYVGIYDPERNVVEIYLAPVLNVSTTVKRLRDREIPDRADSIDYILSRQNLGEAFGTKKSKKILQDRQINAVNSSTLGNIASNGVTDIIASAVEIATAAVPSRDVLSARLGNAKYIPPVYMDEGTPLDQVYKLDDIVSQKELANCNIFEWGNVIREGKRPESKIAPAYVGSRIESLLHRSNNQDLRILRYIEHLLTLYRFMSSKKNVCPRRVIMATLVSDDKAITDGLISRFTEATDNNVDLRLLSKTNTTKLLCYAVILCLKIENNFTMDLFDLMHDLHLDRKAMENVCREVGATVKALTLPQIQDLQLTKAEAKEHRLVSLRLPLTFPKPMKGRRQQ